MKHRWKDFDCSCGYEAFNHREKDKHSNYFTYFPNDFDLNYKRKEQND